jgi:hypothetical protein
MQTIGVQDLWSFKDHGTDAEPVDCDEVRRSNGHEVSDYLDLAKKIAELQFRNRDYVLLYRGQPRDYRDHDGRSTLEPAIFRRSPRDWNLNALSEKFNSLELIEQKLLEGFKNADLIGLEELARHRILRWAILQHYEVHVTPLLDVTQSLRIAASFASSGTKSERKRLERQKSEEAYLYVIGVPNISGAISASAEAGLQIIRLASVCPPRALRPHVQEGYLLGEYPEIGTHAQKQLYGLPEIDFGKRLVAKFRFNPQEFWTGGQFQMIGPRALYPSPSQDPLCDLANKLNPELRRSL